MNRHPVHLVIGETPLKMACGLTPRRMPFCTTTKSIVTCPYCLEAIQEQEKPQAEKEREREFFFGESP